MVLIPVSLWLGWGVGLGKQHIQIYACPENLIDSDLRLFSLTSFFRTWNAHNENYLFGPKKCLWFALIQRKTRNSLTLDCCQGLLDADNSAQDHVPNPDVGQSTARGWVPKKHTNSKDRKSDQNHKIHYNNKTMKTIWTIKTTKAIQTQQWHTHFIKQTT